MDWIQQAQDRALDETVMNFQVHKILGISPLAEQVLASRVKRDTRLVDVIRCHEVQV
jgi:hypothetical protein